MTNSPRRRSSSRHRLLTTTACLAMVFTVLLSMAKPDDSTDAQAAVTISKSDPTMAVPRGTPEKVMRFAQLRGSTRIAETRAYVYEVYRLAPLVGIDPAFVTSQSALETADWTSFYWTNHLNPAGIGIGYSGAPSYTWSSGTAAARNHLVRLYIYVAGPIAPDNPLYPYQLDGPPTTRVFDLGYDGQCHIIDDLTGRWAVDTQYGQKIANRGNSIFATAVGDPTEPAVPVSAVDASGGNNPWRTRDSDAKTSFAVEGISDPPPGAYIQYDLGRRVVIQSIQWLFRRGDFADAYSIQTSNDKSLWTTRGSYTSPAALKWNILTSPATARYVRFLFEPGDDLNLGYLSEVEFYGHNASGSPTATPTPFPSPTATNIPTATSTPTPTPGPPTPTMTPSSLAGSEIPIVGGGGSGSGNWSGYVRDGSTTTTWQTIPSPAPNSAQVYVDLGSVGTITGTEFMFRRTSGARQYQIRVSSDKVIWTTVAIFNYANPLNWQRAQFAATGRYVQFLFANPTKAAALGFLAEISVFGVAGSFAPSEDPPTATSTNVPTATSSPTVTEIPILPIPTATSSDDFEEPNSTPTDAIEPQITSTPSDEEQASPIAITVKTPVTRLHPRAHSTSALILFNGLFATNLITGEFRIIRN